MRSLAPRPLKKTSLLGQKCPRMVRISEEIQNSEVLKGRCPRTLRAIKSIGQEAMEAHSVKVYSDAVCRPSMRLA